MPREVIEDLTPSLTTHIVNYKGNIIVIKNIPCEECEQYGEKYYSDEVAQQIDTPFFLFPIFSNVLFCFFL